MLLYEASTQKIIESVQGSFHVSVSQFILVLLLVTFIQFLF